MLRPHGALINFSFSGEAESVGWEKKMKNVKLVLPNPYHKLVDFYVDAFFLFRLPPCYRNSNIDHEERKGEEKVGVFYAFHFDRNLLFSREKHNFIDIFWNEFMMPFSLSLFMCCRCCACIKLKSFSERANESKKARKRKKKMPMFVFWSGSLSILVYISIDNKKELCQTNKVFSSRRKRGEKMAKNGSQRISANGKRYGKKCSKKGNRSTGIWQTLMLCKCKHLHNLYIDIVCVKRCGGESWYSLRWKKHLCRWCVKHLVAV